LIGDLEELPDGEEIQTGICIIGAGAAGIGIAMEFVGLGLDVMLLESGGLYFEPETQDLARGEINGLSYFALDTARLRYFGGSTNHWGGQSVRLDPEDFARREWVPHSGWPISFDSFAEYIPRAERLCKLTLPAADEPTWELHGGLPAFPFVGGDLQPVLLRFPAEQFSFGSAYRRILEAADDVHCMLHANVLRIDANDAGTAVSGLRLGTLSGKRMRLRAQTYVLAAGGIENTRLMLISGPEGSEPGSPGLANGHDVVGKYFMEHPNYDSGLARISSESSFLARAQQQIGSERLRFDFRLSPEVQQRERILNHSAFLLRKTRPAIGERARRRLMDAVFGSFDLDLQLRVRLEQAPYPESRVTLADETDAFGLPLAKLTLRMGELEARTIAVVQDAFAAALGADGLGRMRVDFDDNQDWMSRADWQYHHCGGTRMHQDARQGVVDSNCRVHGMNNLYVAGSSIFPTAGHANPTMNLLALALRLADHLKDRET